MIENPQCEFELIENAVAAQLEAQPELQNLKRPDGSAWNVLTQDEGEINFMYAKMIDECGLAVIVQTPFGQSSEKTMNVPGPRFDPLRFRVQVSEAVLFNRDTGTKLHVQTVASIVRRSLHLFTIPDIAGARVPLAWVSVSNQEITAHPETGALVAEVLCEFKTTYNEQSKTIQ